MHKDTVTAPESDLETRGGGRTAQGSASSGMLVGAAAVGTLVMVRRRTYAVDEPWGE